MLPTGTNGCGVAFWVYLPCLKTHTHKHPHTLSVCSIISQTIKQCPCHSTAVGGRTGVAQSVVLFSETTIPLYAHLGCPPLVSAPWAWSPRKWDNSQFIQLVKVQVTSQNDLTWVIFFVGLRIPIWLSLDEMYCKWTLGDLSINEHVDMYIFSQSDRS